MKVVFNYRFFTCLWLSLLLASLASTVAPSEAKAETYYTSRSVLSSFFPKSEKVSYTTFSPSKTQRAQLKKELGYELSKSSYHFFVATTEGHLDGYAFIDDVMGQHLPITFAVKLSPEGVVLREEVMVYREAHGDEIRNPRFSKQFRGKTVHDSMRPNKDIDCVSGATISSRAITLGVRRALVLFNAGISANKTIRVSQAN